MSSIAMPRIRPSEHRETLRPLALAAPLLLLLFFSFGAPIVALLSRAVYEPTIANALPHTVAALRQDSSAGEPDEPVFLAFAADLREAQAAEAVYEFAKVLNTRLSGARSQVLRAARYVVQDPAASKEGMIQGRAAARRTTSLDGDPGRHAPVHDILSPQRLRFALDRPRDDRRGSRRSGRLHPRVRPDVSDRDDRYARDARARPSAVLSHDQHQAHPGRNRPCSRAAAVLDLDPGPHRRVDRDLAGNMG